MFGKKKTTYDEKGNFNDFGYLYAVYDTVAEQYKFFAPAQNDCLYIRAILPMLNIPLRDCYPVRLFKLNKENCPVTGLLLDKLDWTAYQYPTTREEACAPLGLSKEDIEKMNNEDKKNKEAK